MKTIVTHLSPDLDAVTSTWLLKKYLPGWEEADIAFVPAERTLNDRDPDENPHIIHVDTGKGKFDHHQAHSYTSATKLVFDHLVEQNCVPKKDVEALERLTDFVTIIDNFGEVHFPDPTADVYDFSLHQIIFGLKAVIQNDYKLMLEYFDLLEAELITLKIKISAEKDVKKGITFQTKWGKALAMESKNEEAIKIALKTGYDIALRKDPDRGFLKVKSFPKKGTDLTEIFNKFKEVDPDAYWSLQANKHIIINGSALNPEAKATKITLPQAIEIIREM